MFQLIRECLLIFPTLEKFNFYHLIIYLKKKFSLKLFQIIQIRQPNEIYSFSFRSPHVGWLLSSKFTR